MRGSRSRNALVVLGVALFIGLVPAAAIAHGDLQGTTPEDGATLGSRPKEVAIVFTEPPTNDSRFEVLDGCGDDVFAGESGQGAERRLAVDGGEPGKWKVTYRVISAEDGHFSKGGFGFRVEGRRDCSEDRVGNPGPRETSDVDPDDDLASDEEASFPVVPILLAGGAVILLALGARFFSSR